VLRIQGVVYFDGELVLDNNQQATYDGRGTIYVVWKAAVRKQHQPLRGRRLCHDGVGSEH
jgi:hypothetical protein